ncbi:MAG: hypothetical protein A2V65_12010 [Deltaproteobacteria bacterium RBG_13_49_15]|nr:MAG: hypothetical protein A2V65_12010 [Deltaproteobacteria bacterium RBG_13_49_15]
MTVPFRLEWSFDIIGGSFYINPFENNWISISLSRRNSAGSATGNGLSLAYCGILEKLSL